MSDIDPSGVVIRRPAPDELRAVLETVEAASGDEVPDEVWPYLDHTIEPDRAYGAFDGAMPVGGGAVYSYRLTVPGGATVGAAGVTFVGVQATHRRRGILRRMMAGMLADARARQEPVAILWASESSIYGRFGYGLASLNGKIEIERERTQMRSTETPVGSLRMIDADEALRLLPPMYDAVAAGTPGFFSRSRDWWQYNVLPDLKSLRRGGGRKFYVIHERDGEPVAYALYRVIDDWGELGPLSTLQTQEVLAIDAAALREIWRYLFGVDLIHKIRARVGPPDHPLLLMMAEPRRLGLRLADGLWLRLLDIEAALGARSYAGDGSLVFDLSDQFLPDLAGTWQLDVAGGRATIGRTNAAPELALDVADLGAVYLGAFSFGQLERGDRLRAAVPDAVTRADAMFNTAIQPWCAQVF